MTKEKKNGTEYIAADPEYQNTKSCTKFVQEGRRWRLIIASSQERVQTAVTWKDGEVTNEREIRQTQVSLGQLVFPSKGVSKMLHFIDEEDFGIAMELLERLKEEDYDRVNGVDVKKEEEAEA